MCWQRVLLVNQPNASPLEFRERRGRSRGVGRTRNHSPGRPGACLRRPEGEVPSELPVPSLDVALAVAIVPDWEVS